VLKEPWIILVHETLNRIMYLLFLMPVDLNLLNSLMKIHEHNILRFSLHLNNQHYDLEDVSITHSPTPVHSPTTRGGVYFSDKFAFKIKGIIQDLSVIPLLSKTMLGPNTDFGEIEISTQLKIDGKKRNLSLFTNLINSVQNPSQVELNMILVKMEIS